MRMSLLFTGLLTLASGCASMSLTGSIDNGRYVSPNGKVSMSEAAIALPDGSSIRDFYDKASDRGLLEVSNDFGLHGLYYAPLAPLRVSMPTNAAERRAALGAVLKDFAMENVFGSIQPPAELEHQEFVPDGDAESLLVVVRLPGQSGAWDMQTGKHFDAHVVALIQVRNDYAVVLRTQGNMADVGEAPASGRAPGSLKELNDMAAGVAVLP